MSKSKIISESKWNFFSVKTKFWYVLFVTATVSGAGVAVLLFFLCCYCILKASKKEETIEFEEKQHLVKPHEGMFMAFCFWEIRSSWNNLVTGKLLVVHCYMHLWRARNLEFKIHICTVPKHSKQTRSGLFPSINILKYSVVSNDRSKPGCFN